MFALDDTSRTGDAMEQFEARRHRLQEGDQGLDGAHDTFWAKSNIPSVDAGMPIREAKWPLEMERHKIEEISILEMEEGAVWNRQQGQKEEQVVWSRMEWVVRRERGKFPNGGHGGEDDSIRWTNCSEGHYGVYDYSGLTREAMRQCKQGEGDMVDDRTKDWQVGRRMRDPKRHGSDCDADGQACSDEAGFRVPWNRRGEWA